MFAAFSAGTTLLTLCTNDDNPQLLQAVLDQLLGTGLCAALVGQGGIADLDVSLLELRDGLALLRPDLALGTPSELLDARVTVAELTEAALNVLGANDPNALAAILNNEEIRLGDLLSIDPSYINSAAALATKIGVSDLISAGVLLANQQCIAGTGCYANGIPVSINLGIANLSVDVSLIQAPVIAIGPIGCIDGNPARGCTEWRTEAQPSQLSISSAVEINVPATLNLSLNLEVTGGGARAGITTATRLPEGEPGDPAAYELLVGAVLNPLTLETDGSLTLPIVDLLSRIPLLGNLLNGVLNLLGLGETIISAHPDQANPPNINLSVIEVSATSNDDYIDWPSESSTVLAAQGLELTLLQEIADATNSNITLTSRVENCLLFIICRKYDKPMTISLGQLLSSVNGIQQTLVEILSQQLFPVLEALGIGLNETEIRILDINTGGSATLVI